MAGLHYPVSLYKLCDMKRDYDNTFSYLLIALLGFTLMLGQMSKLHMHVSGEHTSAVYGGHSIAMHPAYSQQDTIYDAQYQNDNDRPAEIEVVSGSLVKDTESFNPFILMITLICLSIYILFLSLFRKKWLSRIERPPVYYLFNPPLRAPPQTTSV